MNGCNRILIDKGEGLQSGYRRVTSISEFARERIVTVIASAFLGLREC
jgi:hypothetical protein